MAPRVGQNPMRWNVKIPETEGLSALTISCVPTLEGYWRECLEVLRVCIESFLATAPKASRLCVFDNGSTEEVLKYLQDLRYSGAIEILIESRRNIGKVGAWNALFSLPLATTVTYFDSDVYFLPGWFEASEAVLKAFPEASTVTAQPIPGSLEQHCSSTLEGARADDSVRMQEGASLIPEQFVESHRKGLGAGAEEYQQRLLNRRDVLLKRGEVGAFVSSSHFQFMGRSEALKNYFPLPTSQVLGDDHIFDTRVDESGRWRLSTCDYKVHHLGNRIPDFDRELPWLKDGSGVDRVSRPVVADTKKKPDGLFLQRLRQSPFVRKVLKRLNRATYSWLYPKS